MATVGFCGLGALGGLVAYELGIPIVATPADVLVLVLMALVAALVLWVCGLRGV